MSKRQVKIPERYRAIAEVESNDREGKRRRVPDTQVCRKNKKRRIGKEKVICLRFLSVAQEWDYLNPCCGCGYTYLKSATKAFRLKCCQNGRAFQDPWPQLLPLPDEFVELLLNDREHIGAYGAYYNKLFAIASTGIDNFEGNNKYVRINGPHCVKLQGSTYHYLQKKSMSAAGGINYFTYDGGLSKPAVAGHPVAIATVDQHEQ
jgi:hypothetical protein